MSKAIIIRVSKRLAFILDWRGHRVSSPIHGPQVWPLWRLFSFSAVRTDFHTGWNLWLYSRWGARVHYFAIDRRTPEQRGLSQ